MHEPRVWKRRTPTPVKPTALESMRFDYAWKWFNFHAEQRTRMFNYMLIGMGIFATALVTALDKKLVLEAAVLSSAAAAVALVFCLIDRRNRELYIAAMDVLIDAEKTLVFGDLKFTNPHGDEKTFGISRRIAVDDGERATTLRGHLPGMAKGQHRYWMPFIALGFMTLFSMAALRAWLLYFEAVPRWPVTLVGALVVAVGVAAWRRGKRSPWVCAYTVIGLAAMIAAQGMPSLSLPVKAAGDMEITVGADLNALLDMRLKQPLGGGGRAELGVLATARIGPFASGEDALDCADPAQAQALADLRAALADAQQRQQRVLLLLVGTTDRAPLLPTLRQRFGSDAGLARARVSAVERCLRLPPALSAKAPPLTDVLRVISGPAYTPASAAASAAAQQGMAEDRVVRAVLVGLQAAR